MSVIEAEAPHLAAVRAGVRAEVVTIAWMAIEAVVAIIAGVRAHSVLVTAFGIDSVIELLSGAVLLWRLMHESSPRAEAIERRAAGLSGWLLVLLCAYILIAYGAGLFFHVRPEEQRLGLAVAAAALVFMPLLAAWKRRVNRELNSAALRADIAETVACAGMAAIVLAGVALNRFFGLWWIEYVAGLALFVWIAHEAREAFEAAD